MRIENRGGAKRALLIVVVIAVAPLGGCASMTRTVGGWFGAQPASEDAGEAKVGEVYYAASERLSVHAESSGSSKVVGYLRLHERVVRTRLEHGYAYVTADREGLSGWVDNAQLAWRLPSGGPRTSEKSGATAPVAPPAGASAPAAGSEPTGATGDAAATDEQAAAAVASPTPTSTPATETTPVAVGVPTPESAPPTQAAVAPTPAAPPPTARPSRSDPGMVDPF